METDRELLEAWGGGDLDAADRLIRRHFDGVCRFFRNKVQSGVDDLLQKTFLACVERRDKFRGDASFRAYLFGIARLELFGHYQRRQRDARIDPHVNSVFDLEPSPSRVVAKHHEQTLLLQALRRLPLDLQIALELYYWEELSAAELASSLDLPEGTVRTRLRRARQLLEARLGELAGSPSELESTAANLESWARSLREYVARDRSDSQ